LNDDIYSFYINLEDVAKWLKLNKVEIKKLLLKNFKKNVDYKIDKNKETILLNSFTFKKICMISKSKKAEEVREYFLKIEENLFKYKEYIINKLKQRLK
jgi:phage anti-repressor protein